MFSNRFDFFLEHFMLLIKLHCCCWFSRLSGKRMCKEKIFVYIIIKKKQKTRQIHKCKRIYRKKYQCMKTPWTYFMLDAYCFKLVCVLISMNWIIHKNLNSWNEAKSEFITFLANVKFIRKKRGVFMRSIKSAIEL